MSRKPIAVLVADAHIHPHAQFNEIDAHGNSSRVIAGVNALRHPMKASKDNDVPLFILGDLLHTKDAVPAQVLAPMRCLFENFECTPEDTVILAGNHERPDRWSEHTTLDWLRPYASIVTEPWVYTRKEMVACIDFYCLPWHPHPTQTQEILRYILQTRGAQSPTHLRVLLGHGTVNGAMTDSGVRLKNPEITPETLWLGSFNISFWGDIHKHQQIAPNAWYVGALMQNTFGERDNPAGYVVLYSDLSWERVLIDAPKFKYVEENHPAQIARTADGAIVYARASDNAVITRVYAEHSATRLNLAGKGLRDAIAEYANKFPPPPGVTLDEIVLLVEQGMAQA